jgi:hypothetical protein
MVALVSYNGYSGPLPFLAFFCSTAIKAADDIQPIKASYFLCKQASKLGAARRGVAIAAALEVRYSQRRRKKPFRRVSPGGGGGAAVVAASPIHFSIAILAFSLFFCTFFCPLSKMFCGTLLTIKVESSY